MIMQDRQSKSCVEVCSCSFVCVLLHTAKFMACNAITTGAPLTLTHTQPNKHNNKHLSQAFAAMLMDNPVPPTRRMLHCLLKVPRRQFSVTPNCDVH